MADVDKRFEIFKVVIDKLLLAAILGSIAYFVNVTIKTSESSAIARNKAADRRIEIALEIAKHCSSMTEAKSAMDKVLASFRENFPEGDPAQVSFYVNGLILKAIAPYQEEILRETGRISEHHVEIELFLGTDVLDAYFELLEALFPRDPIPDISRAIEDATESEDDVKVIKQKIGTLVRSLQSTEHAKEKYRNLIDALRTIILAKD